VGGAAWLSAYLKRAEANNPQGTLILDGGGSTTMTLRSRLVTRPSDPTGERPIGDAVVLLR
jgi:exopolysaccharide biosynthesis protein